MIEKPATEDLQLSAESSSWAETESSVVGSGILASFKIPAYRFFYGALLAQMAAMNMQMVARSWYMYELTNSAALLGAVALANGIPMVALSLFGGVLADRVPKKYLLLFGQIGSAVVSLGIAVAISLGTISGWHLLAASFLQGIVMALMMPSRQAIIPEIVGDRLLMNAVALTSAAMNTLRMVAPAFAGFLIALWSIEGVYYIMAVVYVIGALFVLGLPVMEPATLEKTGILHELYQGLAYVRRNTIVLILLVFTFVNILLSMPYMFLLPIFTKDLLIVDPATLGSAPSWPLIGNLVATLGESSARLGLLLSISGIGALIGSIIVASLPNKRRGALFLLSVLVMTISLLIFAVTNSYWLALIIFIPLGLGQAGRMAFSNTLVQSYTEQAYRGRVMSIYIMDWGVMNVGVFAVGILADFTGVQWAIGSGAMLLLVITLVVLAFSPRLRQLQ